MMDEEDYPYEISKTDNYLLKRDGVLVMQGTQEMVWRWLHTNEPFSVSHALKYEGYSIEPLDLPIHNIPLH